MTTTIFNLKKTSEPKPTHMLVCRTTEQRMVLLARGIVEALTPMNCAFELLACFLGLDDSNSIDEVVAKFEEFSQNSPDIDPSTYYLIIKKQVYLLNFPMGKAFKLALR